MDNSIIFIRSYDNKRIDADELINEYFKESKQKENKNEKVELSFLEDDEWILDEK